MAIKRNTKFGTINISNEAIASVASDAVLECYGIVGLVKKNSIHETIIEILKRGNYSNGIFISQDRNSVSISIYVVVAHDIKITEILSEVQKKVKYIVEKTFGIKVKNVNVFAQSLAKED